MGSLGIHLQIPQESWFIALDPSLRVVPLWGSWTRRVDTWDVTGTVDLTVGARR